MKKYLFLFFIILSTACSSLGNTQDDDSGDQNLFLGGDASSSESAFTEDLVGLWRFENGDGDIIYSFDGTNFNIYEEDNGQFVSEAENRGTYEITDELGGETYDDIYGVLWYDGGSEVGTGIRLAVIPDDTLYILPSDGSTTMLDFTTEAAVTAEGYTFVDNN